MESRSKTLAPSFFTRVQSCDELVGRDVRGNGSCGSRCGAKHERGVFMLDEPPVEHTGRGEIFGGIESARNLLLGAKMSVPLGLMSVLPSRFGVDRAEAVVRTPAESTPRRLALA